MAQPRLDTSLTIRTLNFFLLQFYEQFESKNHTPTPTTPTQTYTMPPRWRPSPKAIQDMTNFG